MIAMECTLHLSTSLSHSSILISASSLASVSIDSVVRIGQLIWHVCRLSLSFSLPSLISRHWLIPIVFHTWVHGREALWFVIFLEFNTSAGPWEDPGEDRR